MKRIKTTFPEVWLTGNFGKEAKHSSRKFRETKGQNSETLLQVSNKGQPKVGSELCLTLTSRKIIHAGDWRMQWRNSWVLNLMDHIDGSEGRDMMSHPECASACPTLE